MGRNMQWLLERHSHPTYLSEITREITYRYDNVTVCAMIMYSYSINLVFTALYLCYLVVSWTKSYEELGISKYLTREIYCSNPTTDISNCSLRYNLRQSCRSSSIIGVTCAGNKKN